MAVGITVIKRFTYRGDATEEFSNHYHLSGADPANSTAWRTLFDALAAEEKKVYSSNVSIIRGYGYTSDSSTASSVWSVDLTQSPNTPVAGTGSFATGRRFGGDDAVWIRWKLDRLNTRGKPVYLRKYFHDAWGAATPTAAQFDDVLAAQVTALNAFGTLLSTGAGVDGGRLLRDTGGAAIIGSGSSSKVTTRTLKRRGKRPNS